MKRLHGKLTLASTGVATIAVMVAAACNPPPTQALPVYARKYDAQCKTCHSIAPKLNKTGLAFQANYLNWPGGAPPHVAKGIQSVPLSGLAASTWGNSQAGATGAQFQGLEIFATDGFNHKGGHGGGYWIDALTVENNGTRPGDLDGAWVACPFAGPEGQFAFRFGQFSPLGYQWDGVSTLMGTLPAALDDPIDEISFDGASPAVAVEYFDNRGHRTANGNYVDVGMPFGGHLSLNQDSRLYSPHGVYVHAFRRQGYDTEGLFAYRNGKAAQQGVILTRQVTPELSLLGVAATGGDTGGNQQHVSLQGDYVINSDLALSGRYDIIRGVNEQDFPVAAVTWYPAHQKVLRITGETFQQPGNRSNTFYAFVQF